jgi:IclR family KDG regulon transcriptional repressor
MGDAKDKYILSSVNNALKVLDFLGVRDNIGMTEIVRGCNLDKTSVFKILHTLERKGYVFKTANAKYKLGAKFMNYGDRVAERQDLTEIATPYMRDLRDRCGHPVHLGTLNTVGKVVILHKEKTDDPRCADVRIGFELDAYTNSLGKVLLAFLSEPILKGVVEQYRFRAHTPRTILSVEALYRVLDDIRTQGYGEDSDEQYIGHSSVSAPIFNAGGQCVAGLSVIYPTALTHEARGSLATILPPVTMAISHGLGYDGKRGGFGNV